MEVNMFYLQLVGLKTINKHLKMFLLFRNDASAKLNLQLLAPMS